MDIRNIKTFIDVATLGNYTKAAKELNYTQSTVSTQIQHLEKELGFSLFERIGRQNYLTQGGREFLVYANEIMHLFQKAGNIGKELKNSKGLLRIGILESLLFANFLPVLPKFQHMFPNLEIDIKMGQTFELVSLLKQNQLDIIYVSTAANVDSTTKCYYRRREELVFVAAGNHPLASCGRLTLQNVFDYPFITTEPSGYCFGRLREIASEHNLNLNHSITVDSTTAIISLLKEDKNIAFLPKYSVEAHLKNDSLAILRTDLPPQFYYSQLLCSKEKWLSPFIERLISYLESAYPPTAEG